MLRKIMVPVRGDGKGNNVLRHAAKLAHGHKAHIEVTHCRPRPEDMLPYGVPIPDFLRATIKEQIGQVADQEEEGMRDEVMALARTLGLDPQEHAAGDHATVSFVEETGRQVDVIKRHGRLADLIAVAKPDRSRNIGTNTLKAALFYSGRPVLMCPERPDAPERLGQDVALAWNGSAEAARALAAGLLVMREAETVKIFSTGMDAGPGTTADDVIEYLRLHGVTAELVRFEAKPSAGAAILQAADTMGTDMLIMGAYGDSHERETLFGGNTQTVVDRSPLPVLFTH